MESSLSLAITDLESEIGLFLGWGKGLLFGDQAWDARTQALITAIRKSGERAFYFAPAVEGQESSVDWSFLRPFISLPLVAATTTVAMPDDFGGFEGQIYLSNTGGDSYWPVDLTGPGRVQEAYSRLPGQTGRPALATLLWKKGTTQSAGQRAQLYFFPAADANCTLTFQYYVHPDALSGDHPYAYGGMAHAETLLESCLAIAEQRLDDSMGVHTAKFQERLQASISLDRRNKPQLFGYNGDNSDRRAIRPGGWRYWENAPIRYTP